MARREESNGGAIDIRLAPFGEAKDPVGRDPAPMGLNAIGEFWIGDDLS